jgi:hypothetical protein
MRGPLKLTPAEALDVYLLARSGLFYQREVGEVYGISQSAVSLIVHHKRWRWLLEKDEKGNVMSDEDLRAEIDKLKTRQAELEAKLAGEPAAPTKSEPYQPTDYTANATMGAETMRDFANTIPDRLARDLRADLARGNPLTASAAQLVKGGNERVKIERGSGWVEPHKLESPSGLKYVDAQLDAQDRIDAAERRKLFKE